MGGNLSRAIECCSGCRQLKDYDGSRPMVMVGFESDELMIERMSFAPSKGT